jgi:putative ABC transport system permease protein
LLSSGAALSGHGWDSAALRPYRLAAGRAPQSAGEVVMSRSAGARVGQTVQVRAGRVLPPVPVSGLVSTGPAAAFFATATALYDRPGQADALAVLAAGKVDTPALRRAAPVLTIASGNARGAAEDPSVAAVRPDNLDLGASLGGVAVLVGAAPHPHAALGQVPGLAGRRR